MLDIKRSTLATLTVQDRSKVHNFLSESPGCQCYKPVSLTLNRTNTQTGESRILNWIRRKLHHRNNKTTNYRRYDAGGTDSHHWGNSCSWSQHMQEALLDLLPLEYITVLPGHLQFYSVRERWDLVIVNFLQLVETDAKRKCSQNCILYRSRWRAYSACFQGFWVPLKEDHGPHYRESWGLMTSNQEHQHSVNDFLISQVRTILILHLQ